MELKSYRLKNKLTQSELAKILKIDQTAVSKWETGETMPSASILPFIAEALGCTIDDLYGRGDLKQSKTG